MSGTLVQNVFNRVWRLLTDPTRFWTLALIVISADFILTELIINLIPYTEIDWETYMIQIESYLKGERNYSRIRGPTGPLVYPAGHVRIHEILYSITDSGQNVKVAQQIYGLLYVVSLILSCAIYRKAGSTPNWIIILLSLSKRLHSIFVLRLFNDCWAVVLVQAAIFMFQTGLDDTGVLFYSLALSVKMSILLYLPGLLVILFKRRGLGSTLRYVITIIAIQMLIAVPFLQQDGWEYFQSAFDFGRVFLYKWTVNWRIINENTFLSQGWAQSLLIGHISTLAAFGLFKWCSDDGGMMAVLRRGITRPLSPAGLMPITGEYVATVLFTSNLVGILFARSLHYQFYSWYAHQVPYLAWRSRYPTFFRLALVFMVEYAWNTYPSTKLSSTLLLLANTLLVLYFASVIPCTMHLSNELTITMKVDAAFTVACQQWKKQQPADSKTIPIAFPAIQPKTDIFCHSVLQDQILIIDSFLSAAECKSLVKLIDALPLELTPPKKKGEAVRINYRFSISCSKFASTLHSLLLPHLPLFPLPRSARLPGSTPRLPRSLNSNIRLYKYTPSQHFGPHYDDSISDRESGLKSEWTLLVYLTGIEDGVEGGETLFYLEEKGKERQVITTPLTRGTALLHRNFGNTNQPVLVTYSAPQAFLASGSWKQIQASLLAQLPLRNIHWRSSIHSVLRTIHELNFSLVQFESVRDEFVSQIPVTVLERPLLNIYIVTCEDTDIEAYRHVHKKQIKDWLMTVSSRKNQEWLLLHLVKPEARASGGKLFQLKGSVLEKMRADFNVEKRDRCIQVTWSPGTEASAATWAEFINKVKEGLVHAFDSAISQREDEVKRSESQRQMPGWNFCTFFITKESLSISFTGMSLFEEALLHYEELEQSFAFVLKEKNLSWFGSLITPQPIDDSSPLLSVTKKPYRDLILANSISVFDLRIYLLARRCELLAKLGKIDEVIRKVHAFLIDFARQLHATQASLPRFFIESWIYNSALSVAQQCDEWATTNNLDDCQLLSYHVTKGELLELAQSQLNVIGVNMAYLPPIYPFAIGSQRDMSTRSTEQVSNPDIFASMNNTEFFYDLYTRVTNHAIETYARAKRRKFALKLHQSLAALDLHRGRFDAAFSTYSSLPAHYAPHMWSSIESYTLSQALDVFAKLQKEKSAEQLHIILAFLKTVVDCPGVDLLVHQSDSLEYVTSLVHSLRYVASNLETDLTHPDHPALSIKPASRVNLAKSMDGLYLEVTVHNRLPCSMPADEVIVSASGRECESLRFSTEIRELAPGKSIITLFCPVSCPGTYILESSQIRIAHLKFQWLYKRQSTKTLRRVPKDVVVIQVPPDPLALDIQLRPPNHIRLGHSPCLIGIISSGRNCTSNIVLKLTAAGINFHLQEVISLEEGSIIPKITGSSMVFYDVPANTTVTFKIPYTERSSSHALRVLIELNYTTISEPAVTRILRTTRVITTTLPFSVNVEDFFRGKSLFSKFTISTTSHQHVRIGTIHLETQANQTGLRVVSCPTSPGVMTARPAQPVNALFRIDSDNGLVREPLTLLVCYRMLREEVEDLIRESVEELLRSRTPTFIQRDRPTLIKQLIEALERDASWVRLYELTGELVVPNSGDEQSMALLESIRPSLERHRHQSQPDGNWKEMRIPVDIPQMHVVVAACISVTQSLNGEYSDKQSFYAGKPIPACLSIHTSFHWCVNDGDPGQQYKIRFDVEELVKDWLISGQKRGNFIAKDGGTQNIPLTMIALHHGELPLPKVIITTLTTSNGTRTTTQTMVTTDSYQQHGAQKILVLPRGGKSTFVVGMGCN
ncbi:hypothetical protein AX17_001879 [Amanita inopinata Kibby_2008]|nr:hypothetical protein AX17_001879 [Amanita inopinata Kibby_2008]